jgi:hypothetical protein
LAYSIQQFKSNGLVEGGARPTLFEVILALPTGSSVVADKFRFLCSAASLPSFTSGVIEIPYFGRKTKIAGDTVFPDWTVNIMNDEDFAIRNALEKWKNSINTLESNIRLPIAGNANGQIAGGIEGYKNVDALVLQYGKMGDVIYSYKMVGIWPSNIEAIPLDWERTNTVENFAVTFSYDYWLPAEPNDGTFGQDSIPLAL